jgi:hypothetical protein
MGKSNSQLCPSAYQLIKDIAPVQKPAMWTGYLDGDLDLFVEAYLKWNLEKKG